ncbi:NACHT domain-containing protein [Streptomyces sp. NPDC087297]|uniref:NACHT domain-containing protein n=1 Tax=Streptomyces sp. NPDC087297 TaxID=3365778 RepID=UPI003829D99F
MTTYHYEQLDDERFQHLCQALLTREFPGTQCFPVGQRDGGRDAVQFIGAPKGKYRLFQVKFVRNPFSVQDPHKWLVDTMNGEMPKIRKLLQEHPGALEYVLLTNVAGTAFPEFGSIDSLNEVLNTDVPVPIRGWWRDDLDRRCDAAADVKWAYPDILRGTDVLQAIAKSVGPDLQGRRVDVLRSFAVDQFELDSEVRFKQVELSNDILGLFVDVPAKISVKQDERKKRGGSHAIGPHSEPYGVNAWTERETSTGAATLLLNEVVSQMSDVVVLEGGPGQGKSTLAQYVCQVHRMKILGDSDFDSLPDEHKPKFARFPIKVDLREYATWLSGKNPFGQEQNEPRPSHQSKSLESFMSALISERSGGLTFTPDDLSVVARSSALLVVLDGLDEVAEVRLRNEVVREITFAAKRLKESASSLQLLVTTRPSALAEVSDFPAKMFHRWTLTRLGRDLIEEYAARWARSRRLPQKESAELRKVLADKLNQPHMRDLARNPMQLAILLSVIHTRGSSLPDKRTALYDIYVELFLAREAEKSDIVKKRQEILIDVHRYLAWVLHSEAETGRALGKIESHRLRDLIKDYLVSEGRDPGLADELFTGLAQRVVFLVGAVEGLFEFEVQPLREYFAGRFLYETAPYSPVGSPRAGTKDERFDAVARNTYWLNVTRFYAGCFSKGELPSLVDRLEVLASDVDLGLTSHPRSLAATLVADWVFSQNARSLKKVIDLILDKDGYRSLLGDERYSQSGGEPLSLPDGCGRVELLHRCMEVLKAAPPYDILISVAQLSQKNGSRDELRELWVGGFDDLSSDKQKRSWLRSGYFLGVLSSYSVDTLRDLFQSVGMKLEDGLIGLMISSGLSGYFVEGSEERKRVSVRIMEGYIPVGRASKPDSLNLLGMAANSLSLFGRYFDNSALVGDNGLRQLCESWSENKGSTPEGERFLIESLGVLVQEKREDVLRPDGALQKFIENSSSLLGAPWCVWLTALGWLLQTPRGNRADWPAAGLFDQTVPMTHRLRYARHQAGAVAWWRTQLAAAEGQDRQVWVLAAFLLCGPSTLSKLCPEMDSVVEPLDAVDAQRLFDAVVNLNAWSRPRTAPIETLPEVLSPRLTSMLCVGSVRSLHLGLVEKHLDGYLGNESPVQEVIFQAALSRMQGDGPDWQGCVEAIRRAYRVNSEAYYHMGYFRGFRDMPIDIARKVASNAAAYPHFLVRSAEVSVKRNLAGMALPLSKVASQAGWFEEE